MADETLSIVIPTLQAAEPLRALLAVLAEERGGLVGDIVVLDGGSTDTTVEVARAAGCKVQIGPAGRGGQLAAGAGCTEGRWLLFLHADSVPQPGWAASVRDFIARPENAMRAGYFRFALDDDAPAARRLEKIVCLRNRLLALPYGDQGLLIARGLYETLGGFRPMPLMEDVDLIRRIGRRRLLRLDATLRTSAARYRRDGYLPRMARNALCLTLYVLGVAPSRLVRLYR